MPVGIYPRLDAVTRFWIKVNKDGPIPQCRPNLGPCWIWTAGCGSQGYGIHWVDGKKISSHRYSLQLAGINIPERMQPDHLCRIRRCIRPSHLEVVTHRENLLRGEGFAATNAKKTHCPRGHSYSGYNVIINKRRHLRSCRICAVAKTKAWRKKRNGKKENKEGC